MAVSDLTSFNNGIQGIPGVGFDIDIFDTHTSPKWAIGQRYTRSDGAEFVYSHFGAAVGFGGILVAADASESNSAYGTTTSLGRIYASASVTAIAGETINPGTKGSHFVEIKAGGATQDQFAGGYFQTLLGAGGSYEYRVKGNTVSVAKTTGAQVTYYLELNEPLQQSLDGTTGMRILGSKYANLESATSATDTLIAGATTASHAAATWGWVRALRGQVAIRSNNTPPTVIGSLVSVTDGLAVTTGVGAVSPSKLTIGYAADVSFAGVGLVPVDCNL